MKIMKNFIMMSIAALVLSLTFSGYRAWAAVEVISKVSPPAKEVQGLALQSGNLWVAAASAAPQIYYIDSNGDNIQDPFTAPGGDDTNKAQPTGLVYDGVDLWALDKVTGQLYQLDTSGNILATYNAPGQCSGLAWDGTLFWIGSQQDNYVYTLDPDTGTLSQEFEAPNTSTGEEIYGLTWDGTYLWISDTTGIYQVDSETGFVQQSFTDLILTGGDAYALSWDSGYMWIGSNQGNDIKQLDVGGIPGDPPQVIAVNPAKSSTVERYDPEISAVFDRDMDGSTLTESNFYVIGIDDGAGVVYDGSSRKAIFTYEEDLERGTTYYATVTRDVKDTDGTKMGTDYTWAFTIYEPFLTSDNPGGCFISITRVPAPPQKRQEEIAK